MNLTAKQLAEKLNGKTESAINKEVAKQAKESGLVIIYGSRDNLMEFEGAIHDGCDCYDGGIVKFTKTEVIRNQEECDDAIQILKDNGYDVSQLTKSLNEINALWCPKKMCEKYENLSWAYETEIPHETFEILEDGKVYCIGIVFSINDLK